MALSTLEETPVINTRLIKLISVICIICATIATLTRGQVGQLATPRDPGVRGGPPGGGQPLPGLQVNEAPPRPISPSKLLGGCQALTNKPFSISCARCDLNRLAF